jgi:hypothetical protein
MWGEIWNRKDRTLLFLIPTSEYRHQLSYATRLPHVRVVDWREEFLNDVHPGQKFLNVRAQSELDRLKEWVKSDEGRILCVINTEYSLTRLDPNEREAFWLGFRTDFPYCKCIIVFGVLHSAELVPSNLDQWRAAGRVVKLDEFAGGGTNAQDN